MLKYDQIQMRQIGARLKECRTYCGFTVDDVARTLRTPPSRLDRIEAGLEAPSDDEFTKMASIYCKPIHYFTGELPKPTAPVHLDDWPNLDGEDREELRKFAEFLRWRKEARQ